MDASTDTTTTRTTTTRRHGGWHIAAIVTGSLMFFPGLGMAAGGGFALGAQAFATDDDGYFRFTPDRIESEGVAVATTDLWTEDEVDADAPGWLFDFVDVDLRLRVDGADPTDEVFVAIGRTPDVERYLDGAAYASVTELDGRTPIYEDVVGVTSITPPTDVDIWDASVSGPGEQELTWDARGGRWSIVVMNADGSPDVAADVQIGIRSGALTPIAITLIIVGGITLAGAITLIVIGSRGRKEPGIAAITSTTTAPLAPPTPETAVQLDDDVKERQPVG